MLHLIENTNLNEIASDELKSFLCYKAFYFILFSVSHLRLLVHLFQPLRIINENCFSIQFVFSVLMFRLSIILLQQGKRKTKTRQSDNYFSFFRSSFLNAQLTPLDRDDTFFLLLHLYLFITWIHFYVLFLSWDDICSLLLNLQMRNQ